MLKRYENGNDLITVFNDLHNIIDFIGDEYVYTCMVFYHEIKSFMKKYNVKNFIIINYDDIFVLINVDNKKMYDLCVNDDFEIIGSFYYDEYENGSQLYNVLCCNYGFDDIENGSNIFDNIVNDFDII